jgi:hypothetical protein
LRLSEEVEAAVEDREALQVDPHPVLPFDRQIRIEVRVIKTGAARTEVRITATGVAVLRTGLQIATQMSTRTQT